jgi:DNA-binding NarL/FixJ family response regulator
MLARLLPKLSRSRPTLGSDLTNRELEILARFAGGASNKAIADELSLSVNTVRNYAQSILRKLSAHSKLEAVATAVREGLIDYPPAR